MNILVDLKTLLKWPFGRLIIIIQGYKIVIVLLLLKKKYFVLKIKYFVLKIKYFIN